MKLNARAFLLQNMNQYDKIQKRNNIGKSSSDTGTENFISFWKNDKHE